MIEQDCSNIGINEDRSGPFATEDVYIAEIGKPWPRWLEDVVLMIAERNDWSIDLAPSERAQRTDAPQYAR